jgi:hypothetical protein
VASPESRTDSTVTDCKGNKARVKGGKGERPRRVSLVKENLRIPMAGHGSVAMELASLSYWATAHLFTGIRHWCARITPKAVCNSAHGACSGGFWPIREFPWPSLFIGRTPYHVYRKPGESETVDAS